MQTHKNTRPEWQAPAYLILVELLQFLHIWKSGPFQSGVGYQVASVQRYGR